jgi:signal transduction histidine kinase
VDRIRGLVATMARLGRSAGDKPQRAPCELGALAQEVATLLDREARRAGVALAIAVDADTPKVLAVREQLHQVLLNLVLNAIHASPAGGEVVLEVAPGGPEGKEGASVTVVDEGHGIADEDLERIFDPFYTTKAPDAGTGLGLMICHRIVADHGGTIEVRSRRGEGSSFCVRLPFAPDDPREDADD